jgi:N-acetylglutamate synthase-like GNAT family acetyltransferase
MRIEKITENDIHLDKISKACAKEWNSSEETSRRYFLNKYNNDILPLSFKVFEKEELVGFFAIIRSDTTNIQDITPWLATVFVFPEHRNKGVGKFIQEQSFQIAKFHGFKRLYLWTKMSGYYETKGWKYLEDIINDDKEKVRLYCKEL